MCFGRAFSANGWPRHSNWLFINLARPYSKPAPLVLCSNDSWGRDSATLDVPLDYQFGSGSGEFRSWDKIRNFYIMAVFRYPGPICQIKDWYQDMDDGTLARAQSPSPGSGGSTSVAAVPPAPTVVNASGVCSFLNPGIFTGRDIHGYSGTPIKL